MPTPITRPADGLYADGGLLSPNPSSHGLIWAWRYVNSKEQLSQDHDGGVLTCADLGLVTCENNLAETLAVLFGLEALPDGWAGTVYTDNLNALRRAMGTSTKMGGVPAVYVDRLAVVRKRLGPYSAVLLGGHPTKVDLAKGYRKKDGKPVSRWNVECDRRCQELASAWWDDQVVKAGG